jgi:fatty-acyl-CoA synthase
VADWIVLEFALAKIGAILVTANTSLRAPDIQYVLNQSQAVTGRHAHAARRVDRAANADSRTATRGCRS